MRIGVTRTNGRSRLLACVVCALVLSRSALGDWVDFKSSTISENESAGEVTITLTRTAATAETAIAYLSILDVNTDRSDFDYSPGSIDSSFANLSMTHYRGGAGTVLWLHEDSRGRIWAGGGMDTVVGYAYRSCVHRFLDDGTIDQTFLAASPLGICQSDDGYLLPDGKLYVAALVDTDKYLFRLNEDGTEDTTFARVTTDRQIYAIEVQPSGGILIGGSFGLVGNQVRVGIARISADGSLDPAFDAGLSGGWEWGVTDIKILPDGKVLVGGQFGTWGAISTDCPIVRLNSDGTLDPTFSVPSTSCSHIASDIEFLSSGRLLVAHQTGVSMLEADGSNVPGFQVLTDSSVKEIDIQKDGKILIAGNFTEVNGFPRRSVARLAADGTLDETFDAGSGATEGGDVFNARTYVSRESVSGEVLVGGGWFSFGTHTEVGGLVRLHGSLRVHWDANQSGDQTIALGIVDDLISEGDEQATLVIETVVGSGIEIGATNEVNLTIVDNDPFVDTPIGNQVATAGRLFSLDVSSNFDHPDSTQLSFSATGLPAGFRISAAGVISGTPTSSNVTASPYMVTVTATDSAGASANDQFQLSIAKAPRKGSSGIGSLNVSFVLLLLAVSFGRFRQTRNKNVDRCR